MKILLPGGTSMLGGQLIDPAPDTNKTSVCLIGDPPSERFYSMGICETGLADALANIGGIIVLRQQWPTDSSTSQNRYLTALQGYWNRHWHYPSLLKPPAADLYHILDHTYAHLLSRLPPDRTIITCHDLIPLMVEGYEESFGGKLSLVLFRHSVSYLNKARQVIAVSEATKKAMIDNLGLFEENITVVPDGVEEMFFTAETVPDISKSEGCEYVLQVGATAEPYKNTMNILRSFLLLLKNRRGHIKLLKAGKAYTREQQDYIENEGLAPHIQYLGFVERKELPGIYRKASVLLMPSLCEGFGMPLLEAMACGVPVIASRRGSIVEVAGEAAYYVDPDSPEAIAAGIEKVLKDFTLRNRMIQLGLKQAAKFSWQRTAVETAAVYQRILKQDRGILCKEQG